MIDKWETLKSLMDAYMSWNVNYSFERPVERDMMYKVRKWMDELDERERKEMEAAEGFYFTGVPTFDQKAWDKIIEQMGLQGTS